MAYPQVESFTSFPHHQAMYQARSHHPRMQGTSPLSINPYGNYTTSAGYQQPQASAARVPQGSASPALEDGSRPSLPSISNLLGIADGDRHEPEADSQAVTQVPHQPARKHSQMSLGEQRQRQLYASHDPATGQRISIPPTPPLRNDSVTEHTHSPSTISTGSSLSTQPYFLGSSLNNIEADQQQAAHASMLKRHSVPSQPHQSPYRTSPYSTSPYAPSPGAVSSGSYYSPVDPNYPVSGLYHQRPLPSNFPPSSLPQSASMTSASSAPANNPWEHHHYISPSSQATFPQSQDRYICQTCNKAFSRPSSLKIHSHSHTGEKPFKCPHNGCGKAFSVRSNMKRHERGCHTGGSNGMMSM